MKMLYLKKIATTQTIQQPFPSHIITWPQITATYAPSSGLRFKMLTQTVYCRFTHYWLYRDTIFSRSPVTPLFQQRRRSRKDRTIRRGKRGSKNMKKESVY